MSAPEIDFVLDSPLWEAAPDAEAVIRRAIVGAAAVSSQSTGELAVVLTDDSAIRVLNRQWRGHDEATNVLSFPAAVEAGTLPGAPRLLGDVVIAYETVAGEAAAEGKPLAHHLAHLAVHGYLHLIGYDHSEDDAAETMEQLERVILARLDVPDPYPRPDAEAGI